MIRIIPTLHVRDWWPKVLPLLEPAIAAGQRATPEETLKWLERGDYQLWIAGTEREVLAAATTAISVYPGSKWLTVVHCGGASIWSWLRDGIASIEGYAQGCGCDGVEIFGRVEWGRVLEGYDTAGVVIQKVFERTERRAAE